MRSYVSAPCVALVVALLATAPSPAVPSSTVSLQEAAESLDDWGKKVEILMSDEERDEWEGLENEVERRRFIESFWQRRDPTPGTSANEFRDSYLQRLAFVERRFGSGGTAGYETDFGKVFLIYGPPKEQVMKRTTTSEAGDAPRVGGDAEGAGAEARPADPGESGAVEGTDDIVWIYDGDNPFLEGATEVRFSTVRRGGGQQESYTVRGDLEFSNEAFLASIRDPDGTAPSNGGGSSAAGTVEPEMRLLEQVVRGGAGRDELSLQHGYHFFPAPGGNTFVTVSFEVGTEELAVAAPAESEPSEAESPKQGDADAEFVESEAGEPEDAGSESGDSGDPETGEAESEATEPQADEAGDGESEERVAVPGSEDAGELGGQGGATAAGGTSGTASLKLFGAVVRDSDEGDSEVLHRFDIPFSVAVGAEGESSTRSIGLPIAPGPYRLQWGVFDVGSQRAATVSDGLEVPDFTGGELRLTSIVLHSGIQEKNDQVELNKVYEGMRLGSVLISTDLDREFGRRETLELLYFVMGAKVDSATQKPQLEVDHRILRASDDQGIARLPTQELDYVAVGQQIPLAQVSQIAPGEEYAVEIVVRDLVGDGSVTRRVPFHVRAEADAAGDEKAGEPAGGEETDAAEGEETGAAEHEETDSAEGEEIDADSGTTTSTIDVRASVPRRPPREEAQR